MKEEFIDVLAHAHVVLDDGVFQSTLEDEQGFSLVPVLFFPGCSFITSAPDLVATVEKALQDAGICSGISLVCCGKILDFGRGYADLKDELQTTLKQRLLAVGVKEIVTACPNCAVELRKMLEVDTATNHIKVTPLPQVLSDKGMHVDEATIKKLWEPVSVDDGEPYCLTVHDSCPDREKGEFAQAVRELLSTQQVVEMKHNRKTSFCCGAIAQANGKDRLVQDQIKNRVTEAQEIASSAIVTYCMSCSRYLGARQQTLPTYHYLEFMFGKRIDWKNISDHVEFRLTFDEEKGVCAL